MVIVLFRDPYDWVEAMRIEPHHAHDHLAWYKPYDPAKKVREMAKPLPWKEFVTKPWIGRRGKHDEQIRKKNQNNNGGIQNATCMDHYTYVDVAPCLALDSIYVKGLADYKYELRHDGSERGYPSIIDLRRDKIKNMLSVSNFTGTRAFFSFQYEDLNWNGTSILLRSIEEATGLKAKCNATMGKNHGTSSTRNRRRHLRKKTIRAHDALPDDFIQWMNRYVDWEVEGKIGYTRRGGGVANGGGPSSSSTKKETTTTTSLIVKESSPKPTTTMTPVQQIVLLGERHSGTNWITTYLKECFDITVSPDTHYHTICMHKLLFYLEVSVHIISCHCSFLFLHTRFPMSTNDSNTGSRRRI